MSPTIEELREEVKREALESLEGCADYHHTKLSEDQQRKIENGLKKWGPWIARFIRVNLMRKEG
jgi:hypothetical protein